jgi:hypothetical protein
MADKCPWVRSSRGKDYPCSKGPFREPADAYEPYSPYCREHYEMDRRHQQKHCAKRRLELAADPDALAERRGAVAESKRRESARNREHQPDSSDPPFPPALSSYAPLSRRRCLRQLTMVVATCVP